MDWREAASKSPSKRAMRRDGERTYYRDAEGAWYVVRGQVEEVSRERVEGYTDWEPAP
jgi:hypothetical protein